MRDMNLSRVEVRGSVMWHGGKIRLSQLPKVSGKIYGLKREDIITEKEAKLNAAAMKRLHVQPSVFLDRKPKGFIREIFGAISTAPSRICCEEFYLTSVRSGLRA